VPDVLDDIARAYQAREPLHQTPELEAYRLFHGYSEGLVGLEVDRYGDTAIITSKGADASLFAAVADCLFELGAFPTIIAKERGKPPLAIRGTLPSAPQVVLEHGLRFAVETWAPLNPGLYLDARPARTWLREHSQGMRILNLFSFAGSLGVAAMAGGARSLTHVDTQKRALKRCGANHALNAQHVDHRDLVCEDALRFLGRALSGSRRFGGVIVDPPPNREGKRQGGNLSPIALAAKTLPLVEPGGWILCFFHHDERSWDELEAGGFEAVGTELDVTWRGQSGSDFPEVDEHRRLRLSSFAV
jgi:23S rRNA (cytosine1962-C5)-methyltransferase